VLVCGAIRERTHSQCERPCSSPILQEAPQLLAETLTRMCRSRSSKQGQMVGGDDDVSVPMIPEVSSRDS
jgi:hypothetical protein